MQDEKIILGIDPGTLILGYGLILARSNYQELIYSGIIDMRKISEQHLKMKKIYLNLTKIIDKFHPVDLAVEAPFYGKNVQSMLKLGRAQGVVMAAGISRSMNIFEYAPRKVKMAVTGNGHASKEQVATLITKFLNLTEIPEPYDASDAIAVALCHHFQKKINTNDKGAKTWKEFMRKNPGRVK